MSTSRSTPPDLRALLRGLRQATGSVPGAGGPADVLDRRPNDYADNGRSEVLTCRFRDGSERRLLCKYEAKDTSSWSNVAYEAEVYRHVLSPCRTGAPAFYGAYRDTGSAGVWLFLEFVDDSMALAEWQDSERMCLAARWLGQFHAAQEPRAADTSLQFLKQYRADFYVRWARQALQYSGDSCREPSWLRALVNHFEAAAPALLEQRRTIVHGDFYPHNVLLRGGAVCPVDWEMAGVDVGEADLATLTDGWPEEIRRQCALEYGRSRWAGGAPADFEQTLAEARLGLCFYNLGTRPDWPHDPMGIWYSNQLRRVGEGMGLL